MSDKKKSDREKEMIAIPGQVMEHMVGLGARFGAFTLFQAMNQRRMMRKVIEIMEKHGIEPENENDPLPDNPSDLPDCVQDDMKAMAVEEMRKFLLSDTTRGVLSAMKERENNGDLFHSAMGLNQIFTETLEYLKEEGYLRLNNDDDEEELAEAEPESEMLN